MKIKLKYEELIVLLRTLEHADIATFNTHFESRICGVIIREFALSLMKKSIDKGLEQRSVKLDEQTALALNYVLPQLFPADPYDRAVLTSITTQINQKCLSIS